MHPPADRRSGRLPGGTFAKRERVVAAHHDVVDAEHVDEEAKRGLVEDDTVDAEPSHVSARWPPASTADDVAPAVPGVVGATEPEREGAAAVGEGDPK